MGFVMINWMSYTKLMGFQSIGVVRNRTISVNLAVLHSVAQTV